MMFFFAPQHSRLFFCIYLVKKAKKRTYFMFLLSLRVFKTLVISIYSGYYSKL
jgi:hypothetical protein